ALGRFAVVGYRAGAVVDAVVRARHPPVAGVLLPAAPAAADRLQRLAHPGTADPDPGTAGGRGADPGAAPGAGGHPRTAFHHDGPSARPVRGRRAPRSRPAP